MNARRLVCLVCVPAGFVVLLFLQREEHINGIEEFPLWVDAFLKEPTAATIKQGVTLAAARAGQMRRLMEERPAEALAASIPQHRLARLPLAVRAHAERWVAGLASVEVLCAYPKSPNASQPHVHDYMYTTTFEDGSVFHPTFVYGRRLGRRLTKAPAFGIVLGDALVLHESPLRMVSQEETSSAPASTCPVTGQPGLPEYAAEVEGKVRLFSSAAALEAVAQQMEDREDLATRFASQGTTGALSTIAIIITFAGESAPVSEATFTALMTKTNSFWTANSYGTASYQFPITYASVTLGSKSIYSASCPITGSEAPLDNDAWDAVTASLGFVEDDFDRYVLCFSEFDKCSWAGLGQIAAAGTWINGLFDPTSHWHILAHEFGHNYGLKHSNLWTSGVSPAGDGQTLPYGDDYDVMGAVYVRDPIDRSSFHVNAEKKAGLGWIPDADVAVAHSGTQQFRVFAQDMAPYTSGLCRAVRVPKDSTTSYWLDYKPGLAFASAAAFYRAGLSVHWGYVSGSYGIETDLLDMTAPYSADNYDANLDNSPLGMGVTFVDGDIHITPVSKGSVSGQGYVDVFVYLGPSIGNTPPQIVELSVSCASPEVEEAVLFTVLATDADDGNLAYSWNFGDGSPAEGSSTTVSRAFSAAGSRTISVTVSDMRGGTAAQSIGVAVSTTGLSSCAPCANNCNDVGLCAGGACKCSPGYTAADCGARLAVGEISPNYGDAGGGGTITVTAADGTIFGPDPDDGAGYVYLCSFVGVGVQPATWLSSTQVSCVFPSAAEGTVTVEISTNEGRDYSNSRLGFTYGGGFCPGGNNCSFHGVCDLGPGICHCDAGYAGVGCNTTIALLALSPNFGPYTGNTRMAVSVSGFDALPAVSDVRCQFGPVTVVPGTFSSPSTVTCSTPPYTVGMVAVTVSPNGGVDWTDSAPFEYSMIVDLFDGKSESAAAGATTFFRLALADAAPVVCTLSAATGSPSMAVRAQYTAYITGGSGTLVRTSPGQLTASETVLPTLASSEYLYVTVDAQGGGTDVMVLARTAVSRTLELGAAAVTGTAGPGAPVLFTVRHVPNVAATAVIATDANTGARLPVYLSRTADIPSASDHDVAGPPAILQPCDPAGDYKVSVSTASTTSFHIQARSIRPPVAHNLKGAAAGQLVSVDRFDTHVLIQWPLAYDEQDYDFGLQYEIYVREGNNAAFEAPCDVRGGERFEDRFFSVGTWGTPQMDVGGLSPSTSYDFAVLVRNSEGAETVYTPISQRTKPPSLPKWMIIYIAAGCVLLAVLAGCCIACVKLHHSRKRKSQQAKAHVRQEEQRKLMEKRAKEKRARAAGHGGHSGSHHSVVPAPIAAPLPAGKRSKVKRSSSGKHTVVGIALADFSPKFNNELTFRKGDHITLVGEAGAGWIKGRLDGREGLVPASYVKKLKVSA